MSFYTVTSVALNSFAFEILRNACSSLRHYQSASASHAVWYFPKEETAFYKFKAQL